MKKYRDFRPTVFDPKGLALDDQQDWLVLPCGRNRDSGILSESNFHVALESLGGEGDHVEVHRFGHWACGWFEIIVIDPSSQEHVKKAEEIEASLENYPILDGSDFSEREWEEKCSIWEHASHFERLEYCRKAGIDGRKARCRYIPDDVDQYINVDL